jgi:hypothetical protein
LAAVGVIGFPYIVSASAFLKRKGVLIMLAYDVGLSQEDWLAILILMYFVVTLAAIGIVSATTKMKFMDPVLVGLFTTTFGIFIDRIFFEQEGGILPWIFGAGMIWVCLIWHIIDPARKSKSKLEMEQSKENIEELKGRVEKSEKTTSVDDRTEKCHSCGRIISRTETPWILNNHVVCAECWQQLKNTKMKPKNNKMKHERSSV